MNAYNEEDERERQREVTRPLHALRERHAVAARLLPVEFRRQQLQTFKCSNVQVFCSSVPFKSALEYEQQNLKRLS